MLPRLLFADDRGRVFEHPVLRALALTPLGAAPAIDPPVALPPHATLSVLPGRRPLGLDPENGEIVEVHSVRIGSRTVRPTAVGAVLPPGWTRLALPAYHKLAIAPVLPQWAYTMAGWDDEAGHVVWALRTDRRSHWDPASHSTGELPARVEAKVAAHPRKEPVPEGGAMGAKKGSGRSDATPCRRGRRASWRARPSLPSRPP